MDKKPSVKLWFRTLAAALLLLASTFATGANAQTGACFSPITYAGAGAANGITLRTLAFSPFGRAEAGWEIYLPMVQKEIGSRCGPGTAGFSAALARWQARARVKPTGVMDPATFLAIKTAVQLRRPFVLQSRQACPAPPAAAMLAVGTVKEGYGGKTPVLRAPALAAYRRMVEAARQEVPSLRTDARMMTIFSSYRSPDYDAARCARDGNCDGIRRATCSPHRTGYAMDLYLGSAFGFGPDSTADLNRLHQSRSPAYRWLVANASRFGFANYPFEPWHWEWIGP